MVFVPLEGNLTPEEQHAKMMERLDEMSGEVKQQKSRAKGERRTTRKLFRTPDIRIKYMPDIYSDGIIVSVIQARKDALDLAKKIEDKYRSPMNRYGFLHEMCSTQGIDDPQTVKELAHVNLRSNKRPRKLLTGTKRQI